MVLLPQSIFLRGKRTYTPELEREWKILGCRRSATNVNYRIRHLVSGGLGSLSTPTLVTADYRFQAKAIALHLARHLGLCLLGAYHTHPANCPTPSKLDRQTALDFVLERNGVSGWGLEQFLVLIGTRLNGEFTIRAYVIGKSHQEFVEIPVVITGSEERTLGHVSDAR